MEDIEMPNKKPAEQKTKKTGRHKKSITQVVKVWNFPKNTLEEALVIAKEIEDKHGGKPIKADDLVSMVGYHKANDWRFTDLLKSSSQYGLTTGTGTTATVAITKLASDIITPGSPDERKKALLEAFFNVELFKKVSEQYEGKRIPEDEYFSNILIKSYDIPRERVSTFISVFTSNLAYLKAFNVDKDGNKLALGIGAGASQNINVSIVANDERKSIREFLDTCFIIMPFGEWYDQYYSDIYVPATKDAGFEPVRADELFTTGSVVEQIWEQINKASVLLAELTGKNANAFYELGLAHAVSKPVVLITGNLDDIPFDLRHLRTVVYDVREPNWAQKLHRDITSYLKSAKQEPEKSIPQPFRYTKNDNTPKRLT